MEKKMQGSLGTLLVKDDERSLVNPEAHVEYVPVWDYLPRQVRVKRNIHVPKHHDTLQVPLCTKFGLLLCKELKLMTRKKLIFWIQVLVPILIMVIFNLRVIIVKHDSSGTTYSPFILNPVQMQQCGTNASAIILVAPRFDKSSVVEELTDILNMETARLRANIKYNYSSFSDVETKVEQHPDLNQINKLIGKACGTVHFTNKEILDRKNGSTLIKKGYLPKKMNYQIRLRAIQWSLITRETTNTDFLSEPSRWATDRVYPKDVLLGPRNKDDNFGGSPGYVSEGFLFLQRTIDFALTKMTYQNLADCISCAEYRDDFTLQLSRFPFPALESTTMVYLIRHELQFYLLLAYFFQIVFSTYLAVKEKESGAKGFLHSFSISRLLHWIPFILKTLLQYSLVNFVITCLLCTRWYEDKASHIGIMDKSTPSLVFVLLEMITLNTCAFACLISVFFVNPYYAASTAGFYWIVLNLPIVYFDLSNFVTNPLPVRYAQSLFAQTALRTALQTFALAEATIGGEHWHDIFVVEFSLGDVMLMLGLGTVLCILIAVYIENVFPKGGHRKLLSLPFFYFLHCWWWRGQLRPDDNDAPEDSEDKFLFTEFFEPDPVLLKQELQLKQVSKCYVGDVGVFNVTMNFFEGEITVILGPKGSGKTTLAGLIAGQISPTRGSILVNNLDIRIEARYTKYNIGTCPAEDYLYDYLTVEEHISLYAQLKGYISMADALDETDTLINGLKLKSARTTRASELSISEKRLVHVAIAFSAGSKVVLLDEPTAKADASTKRIIWKFCKREKRNRTIVIFTNDCEEVNFVAERLAVLAHGELQCRGTVEFIKSAYGGGYHLKIVRGERFKFYEVTNLVKVEVPHSRVENELDNAITYYLPGDYISVFSRLLQALEKRKTSYDIQDIILTYYSMDEVFKMICNMASESDAKLSFKQRKTLSESLPQTDVEGGTVTFPRDNIFSNYYNQFRQLFMKNVKVTLRRKFWLAVPALISIIVVVAMCGVLHKNPFNSNLPSINITLDTLQKFNIPKFLVQCQEQYNGNSFCDIVADVAKKYATVEVMDDRDFEVQTEDLILEHFRMRRTLSESGLFLAVRTEHAGIMEMSSKLTVFFNNQPLHIPPVAVNYASNLILRASLRQLQLTGRLKRGIQTSDYWIYTENYPLEYEAVQILGLAEDYWSAGFYLGLTFSWAMTFFIPFLIVFPIREKYFKHIQVISGLNTTIYWLAKLLWDMILYTGLVAIMCTILHFMEVLKYRGTRNEQSLSDYLQFVILLELFGFASIGLINSMVPLFKRSGVNGYFYSWLVFFMTGPFPLSMILVTTDYYGDSQTVSTAVQVIHHLLLIFPNCALGLGIFNVYARYKYDTDCTEKVRKDICGIVKRHGCCIDDPFFHTEHGFGIGENIMALVAFGLITHGLTMYMETDAFRRIRHYLAKETLIPKICCCERKVKVKVVHADDLPEIDFGDQNTNLNEDNEDYEIVLTNLLKQTKRGDVMLDIPRLRLRRQECTCCFGVDGSGKRMLLKIVAGLITPDLGDVKINKKSLLRNYSQYIKRISYSPDHETYLPELTAKETLHLCGILSRIPNRNLKSIITTLCLKFNLFHELENKVGDFSAGTLRKLAVIIAILNSPEILILEEPTLDVDQTSRLQIIKALTELKKTTSLLISTSDIDLCEQICDRVLVFVNGRICCFGSPGYLKETYCENTTITAKRIPDAPQFYLPGNVVDVGWDYEKEEAEPSINMEEAISAQFPRSESVSQKSMGAESKTSIHHHHHHHGHGELRFLRREPSRFGSPGPETKPRASFFGFGQRFSIFGNNKVAPEPRKSGSPATTLVTKTTGARASKGPVPLFNRFNNIFAPRESMFDLFMFKNLPKYEYHSTSSSSETFASITRMEHWQVELLPIINFIETQYPEAELINIYPCFVQYLLRNEAQYSDIFQKMEVAKKYLDVEHYSIGHMSLEQFFHHYASGQTYHVREEEI